ncbi:MAG: cbb3-type cytochrome c oxidase subunit 3 [Burkholderiales bacterium]|jgi:cytochrome c oxidase cbb3-type subunit 4|nr:cbb3-type cytochrome c oxidase subunit 3 [Burkholderiales bacterium]
MDINLVRSLLTALLFIVFIGIVLWAWSKGKREDFEAAARLPLDDDMAEERMARNGRGRQ